MLIRVIYVISTVDCFGQYAFSKKADRYGFGSVLYNSEKTAQACQVGDSGSVLVFKFFLQLNLNPFFVSLFICYLQLDIPKNIILIFTCNCFWFFSGFTWKNLPCPILYGQDSLPSTFLLSRGCPPY